LAVDQIAEIECPAFDGYKYVVFQHAVVAFPVNLLVGKEEVQISKEFALNKPWPGVNLSATFDVIKSLVMTEGAKRVFVDFVSDFAR
jgi:hypothetical protein